MSQQLENYLLEAQGKTKEELPADNPYRQIGFDGDKKRLGWMRVLPFSLIKATLEEVGEFIADKDTFIFIGMGGSINGIKPLLGLFKAKKFYTIDNLDPAALRELIVKIDNPEKTLVVAISKSGTTKETQLLAVTLRDFFANSLGKEGWKNNFLWLSDPDSFDKLDSLGWQGIRRFPIQFDGLTDVGGRFCSPHTLIFYLPLFLLLGRSFTELEKIYNSFVSLRPQIIKQAVLEAQLYKDKTHAYFSPATGAAGVWLSSWIVQLFQESLGSKLSGLAVKTLPDASEVDLFEFLMLDLDIKEPAVFLISQMFFFQAFIAYYSALKNINFVNQNYVEAYKNQMRQLEGKTTDNKISSLDLSSIVAEVEKIVKPDHHFIEIVLYFYPSHELISAIENEFKKTFPQRQILVFIGSDWNHQSYQAAFASADTFYLLLTSDAYESDLPALQKDLLKKNIDTLILIAQATYITLKDKALLFSLLPGK